MRNYKSAQELIVKAVLHDGVTTTISPGAFDSIKIEFERKGISSATQIDLTGLYLHSDDEEMLLTMLKRTLLDVFRHPYDEITVRSDDDEMYKDGDKTIMKTDDDKIVYELHSYGIGTTRASLDEWSICFHTKNLQIVQQDIGLTLDISDYVLSQVSSIEINGFKFIKEK